MLSTRLMSGPALRLSTRSMATLSEKLDSFGSLLFSEKAQARFVPGAALDDIKAANAAGEPISKGAADAFAAGLLGWAREAGDVTHYTHQFQPLTNDTAEKHDSMIKTKFGSAITSFTGKMLAKNEPDGSSFPNGGLRDTHVARGYTMWDPTSPIFLRPHGTGKTLTIPSMFFSYHGDALDQKTPLLRSEVALNKAGLRLFDALRSPGHTRMHCEAGVEQEFFLIDRDYYIGRMDLQTCGRTLFGAAPPKGQELSDQYFGTISQRMLDAIHDAEQSMWALGIPQTTRHREVAPGQYEIAPVFATCNIATDQNLLVMDLLEEAAHRHGLEALFHEKPFAHLNGSGKHNNWSVGSNKIGTVFNPGSDIPSNKIFLASLVATVRAIDLHPDLMRAAIGSASNDHRLGGHEAPPAIISMYLGDDVTAGVEAYANGADSHVVAESLIDLGVAGFPTAMQDTTDRNRTSPFAFTGNKFEFRAVGSSHNVSESCTVLNTIFSDSLDYISGKIEEHSAKTGAAFDDAVDDVLRATYKAHSRVVFNGDNYSSEWHAEAESRGLLNLRTTPDALALLAQDKNVALFEKQGVLSRKELEARQAVRLDNYSMHVTIEARTAARMFNTHHVAAGASAQTHLAAGLTAVQAAGVKFGDDAIRGRISAVGGALNAGVELADKLSAAADEADAMEDSLARAEFSRDVLLATANDLREHGDAIEAASFAKDWTLPTYHDMLFHQN